MFIEKEFLLGNNRNSLTLGMVLMQLKRLLFIFLLTFSCVSFAGNNIPRQKFFLKGKVIESLPKTFKVNFLENFPKTVVEVFDPYQGDKKFSFTGISLCNLFDSFAKKDAKSLFVTAVNDYTGTFPRKDCEKSDLYFVYRQDGNYITTDLMGPLRIIRANLGVIDKLKLAKEGVNWIWMVRDLEFN